jgi:hypothetical protein
MSVAFSTSVRRPKPISEHGPSPAPIPNAVCPAILAARDREPSSVTASVSRTVRFAVRSASEECHRSAAKRSFACRGST